MAESVRLVLRAQLFGSSVAKASGCGSEGFLSCLRVLCRQSKRLRLRGISISITLKGYLARDFDARKALPSVAEEKDWVRYKRFRLVNAQALSPARRSRAEHRKLIDTAFGEILVLLSQKASHTILTQKVEALHGQIQVLFPNPQR
jgi:hypothetical protein